MYVCIVTHYHDAMHVLTQAMYKHLLQEKLLIELRILSQVEEPIHYGVPQSNR